MEKLYTESTWRGHRQFNCKLCPFDVLDNEQDILDHIQNVHMPKVEPEKPVTDSGLLVVRDGMKRKTEPEKAEKVEAETEQHEEETTEVETATVETPETAGKKGKTESTKTKNKNKSSRKEE